MVIAWNLYLFFTLTATNFGRLYEKLSLQICTRCGFKFSGMIFLQASYLYTYSLLRDVNFSPPP
jgi:hypothetical protein